MKIKEITSQNRRDFYAVYVCEGCEATKKGSGYDDGYFHQTVIPEMKCDNCGKSSKDLNVDYRPLTTKYPDGMQL